jgi:hypothetical protein
MNNNKVGMHVDLKSLEDVKCQCGCEFWEQIFAMKKIPVLQSPTGKEEFMPIPFFVCKQCSQPFENAIKGVSKVIP